MTVHLVVVGDVLQGAADLAAGIAALGGRAVLVAATGEHPWLAGGLARALGGALDAGPDAVVVRDGALGADGYELLGARRGEVPVLVVDTGDPQRWEVLEPDLVLTRFEASDTEVAARTMELVTGASPLEETAALAAAYRAEGRRIVFTNGCFDVLHRGHVAYLQQARRLGDVLIVGLNSDASVRRLKGPQRPVNPVADRVSVLSALSCVDHVTVFDEDTPLALIARVRPDVYVKGGDYRPEQLPEAPLVRELGGEVRILGYLADRSTSALIERIRST